eukprot:4267656-Lingulodinium_polyedra.AAC.1
MEPAVLEEAAGRAQGPPSCHALSAKARAALAQLPASRFMRRSGRGSWPPEERGVLDLFAGSKRRAAQLCRLGAPWVLTYELKDGVEQDLSCRD